MRGALAVKYGTPPTTMMNAGDDSLENRPATVSPMYIPNGFRLEWHINPKRFEFCSSSFGLDGTAPTQRVGKILTNYYSGERTAEQFEELKHVLRFNKDVLERLVQ